ncbi:MAG: SRPBCC domain-containing protein [Phycisphaerales bacterium]
MSARSNTFERITMQHPGVQVSTPSDTTISLTRRFAAPRARVWDAMLTPELMRRWMTPPPGWEMTVCECDPRPAGGLRLVWRGGEEGGNQTMALYGVFTEVVPNERITHTENFVLGNGDVIGVQVETHAFTEQGGVTTLHITQVHASKEARDAAVSTGLVESMEAGFRRLDEVLAGVSSAR